MTSGSLFQGSQLVGHVQHLYQKNQNLIAVDVKMFIFVILSAKVKASMSINSIAILLVGMFEIDT
jgi:hypothetical protein